LGLREGPNPLISSTCEQKESGQTNFATDLSALARLMHEILNLWKGFQIVVEFIENSCDWLGEMMKY